MAEAVDDQLAGAVRQTGPSRPLAVAVGGAVDAQVHPGEQGQRHYVAQHGAGHEKHRPHFFRLVEPTGTTGQRLVGRLFHRRRVALVVIARCRQSAQAESFAVVGASLPEMLAGRVRQTESRHGNSQNPLAGQQEPSFCFGHSAVVMKRRHDGAVLVDGDDQGGADGTGRHQSRDGLAGHAHGIVYRGMRVRQMDINQTVHEDERQEDGRGHQVEGQQRQDEPEIGRTKF